MTKPRVLVTGGSRGIGRAIALRFAREGSQVVVAARSSPDLDRVVAEIEAAGGEGLAAQMNVGDEGSVEAAVYRAGEFCGSALDVVVNCAGTFSIAPIDKTTSADWDRHIGVNLTGAFYVTQESLQYLEESDRPHIFNIASIAARQGFPGNVAYCASKYGLRGFSDALRMDLESQNVRVSTVYPRQTDTDLWEGVDGDWDRSQMDSPDVVAEAVWNAYNQPAGADVSDIEMPG